MSDVKDPAQRWVLAEASATEKTSTTIFDTAGVNYSVRGILVAATGAIELVDADGTVGTFSNLPVGVYPLRPERVTENTTATIWLLYGN